ncbi:hypothetical protein RJT34_19050 [Clitoria ternatea]|uniref:Uncharacterized protein n=1 Tax=Clitoria ternatea TaxID=43366 RepID=A0AAN9IQB2_CLITE
MKNAREIAGASLNETTSPCCFCLIPKQFIFPLHLSQFFSSRFHALLSLTIARFIHSKHEAPPLSTSNLGFTSPDLSQLGENFALCLDCEVVNRLKKFHCLGCCETERTSVSGF